MAGSSKEAWNEVGERFSSWGRQVADRYKEMDATAGEGAQEAQRKLEEAARQLTEQLNRAFTAIGDTLRDDKAKTDLKDAVRSIGDAVAVTVTETGDAIRRRVGTGDDADPGEPGGGANAA
ncbi:MAG: hypothetical protein ACXWXQ_03520 [Actinomycetota bacterium]